MENVKLSMDTVLRLQYAIISASVYCYYLQKNNDNIETAANQTHDACITIIHKFNYDLDDYIEEYYPEELR